MAKAGLRVNHSQGMYGYQPRLTWLDDGRKLAELLGGDDAYYAWSSTLPGRVVMDSTSYHAAIKAKLVEVEPDLGQSPHA